MIMSQGTPRKDEARQFGNHVALMHAGQNNPSSVVRR